MIRDGHDELTVRAPLRVSFFFSARGDRAAFLRGSAGSGLGVETWAWQDGAPRRRVLSIRGETLYSQPLALDDGRVLVLRAGPGIHGLVLLTPGQEEAQLGRVESRGLYLLPSPAAGTLAVAVGVFDDGGAALWAIEEAGFRIRAIPAPRVPAGILRGGHWLDGTGRVLGFDHHADGRSRIVAVDLATGAADFADFAGSGNYRLLVAGGQSGRFLAARSASGKVSLGWGRWDRGHWELTCPEEPGLFGGQATPLAIDPAGRAVACRVEDGLRCEVRIGRPGEGSPRRLDLPAGTLLPAARWTPGGLHLVTAAPDRPPNITTVTPQTGRHRTHADPEPPGGWAPARVERLPGPAGPVEALIYGRARWRDAERLLIVLHGGPHTAWKATFDPLFQDLAAAGITIVAPNQRGSTGYGPAHRDAIRGAWGGPDLSDIRHLAGALCAYRRPRGLPPLMILGTSYGAFLALLAAAAEPALWSACAAISPFCSAGSLYDVASGSVRSFLRRLGALDLIDDELGPRDLGRLAGRITARLLIAHGTGDEKIPVSQPRRIVAALEQAGRPRGADFAYHELPGGHDLIHDAPAGQLSRQLVGFLTYREPGDLVSARPSGARRERPVLT